MSDLAVPLPSSHQRDFTCSVKGPYTPAFATITVKGAKPKKHMDLIFLGIQSPCQRMIGVSNHLLSKVFRFHCHSQFR